MISFIDIPRKRDAAEYQACVDHLAKKIGSDTNVVSIYRFGNVTTPGISDVDMLVVFRDGSSSVLNPFDGFPKKFEGWFTHGIDAVSETYFKELQHYSFLENMHLVYGMELLNDSPRDAGEIHLRVQVALEFLVTNYVDLVMQLEYGIVKLRAFLQHTKGLLYDLRLLKITTGDLFTMVEELREKIKNWWSSPYKEEDMTSWIMRFYKVYEAFVRTVFNSHHLYVPPMRNYYYLGNAEIVNGPSVNWSRSGITLPNNFSFLGRKYFNLQRRLNKYTFRIPMQSENIPPLLAERQRFFSEMISYNSSHFPFFDSLTTGFRLKEK